MAELIDYAIVTTVPDTILRKKLIELKIPLYLFTTRSDMKSPRRTYLLVTAPNLKAIEVLNTEYSNHPRYNFTLTLLRHSNYTLNRIIINTRDQDVHLLKSMLYNLFVRDYVDFYADDATLTLSFKPEVTQSNKNIIYEALSWLYYPPDNHRLLHFVIQSYVPVEVVPSSGRRKSRLDLIIAR